jgi:peptide/nickel transport system ATP-binding protein
MDNQPAILQVQNLKKYFPLTKGLLHRVVGSIRAVDDVSFAIQHGETLGLVGESGCGKTTVAKSILRAIEPTGGKILFNGGDRPVDLAQLEADQLKQARRNIQMIFQDPFSSLNPRQRVRDIIGEPLLVNGLARGKDLEARVRDLMTQVGLRPEYMIRYPHAFSGGQRQRIGIARALALQPKLVICDEPVSALDVSIQAQILNLLKDLQEQMGLTYLFISHDLGVVQHISTRVAVMYVGRLVELSETHALFAQPRHPYTEALLSASPKPHPKYRGKTRILSGEVLDPSRLNKGCYFYARCAYRTDRCAEEYPALRNVGTETEPHLAACHYAESLTLAGI